MLVNSGFHTRKNFFESYPQFGHAPSEIFASPVLGRTRLKNVGFKGAPNYQSARGRPHVSGRLGVTDTSKCPEPSSCVRRGNPHDQCVIMDKEVTVPWNLVRTAYDQEKLKLSCPCASLNTPTARTYGGTVVTWLKTISCQPLTVRAWVRFRASPCGVVDKTTA